MSKQILSVSDFALILNMVNERIDMLERRDDASCWHTYATEEENDKLQERLDKDRERRINSSIYLQLKHLQNSLMNLNIEVETPDVELTHQHEDKGE